MFKLSFLLSLHIFVMTLGFRHSFVSVAPVILLRYCMFHICNFIELTVQQLKLCGSHVPYVTCIPVFLAIFGVVWSWISIPRSLGSLCIKGNNNNYYSSTLITCIYYPTALRRVQITPKMSTNITRYLYSKGPVRPVSCL